MIKEILLESFNRDTTGRNGIKGKRILDNDLISTFNSFVEDDLIYIDAKVISENFFNEYSTKIEMDFRNKSIISTYCTCIDYEKHEFAKSNYCCKHLVAIFYKFLRELDTNSTLKERFIDREEGNVFANAKNGILDMLLSDINSNEELKLDVYVSRQNWSNKISADFKIGPKSMSSNKLYVIKDINQFLTAIHNKVPVKYGKDFTFDIKKQKISVANRRLIDFMDQLKDIDGNSNSFTKRQDKHIEGKSIILPKYLIREFFERIQKHRVYLNEGFFYRPVETDIILGAPNIDLELKLIRDTYILKSSGGMPESLTDKGDVFFYGSSIFIPNYEFCYKINPYLSVFNNTKSVTIPASDEKKILTKLIPEMHMLSDNVKLSVNIKNKIVNEEVEFRFYFDKENSAVTLTLKVKYGIYEFNIFEDCIEKIIYRDTKKEQQMLSMLRGLGFEEIECIFHLIMGDDYIFRFFKNEVDKLQEHGEVYYSENFKGIKHLGSKSINGDIKAGKYNYFEMDFILGDINTSETSNILRAFRSNLKYYKLSNGEYLDLEEIELNKFLKLLDVINPDDEIINNKVSFNKNKGAFVDNFLDDNKIRFIKGKKELKEIRDKFKSIDKLKFKEPKDIKADLREYQKHGYNWFKTLDYLGFGGILGDEMGLGKTLQAITFIASNESAKTLIVAPTSLIYNWHSEIERFAPKLKVAIVNGNPDERETMIKNIDKVDVIITTYNLLKRDLETYKSLEFDYCFLDEAQYIKNPHSQNSKAVKEIKAKSRFALTGTPIENSLMELWSIFDFVMPGYLYDEKKFSVRYHKKLKEEPVVLEELNKLIKPFILRRHKKDVITELPDKIEKKLVVSLNDEQKKIYGTYARHATDLIAKKVRDDEFKSSKIEILSYITKLRQLCLDPSILVDGYTGGSGKIDALIELLHQSIEAGHKILVFSQFTSVLKNISERLNNEYITYSYLDGSIPSEKRMSLVKDFNEGDNSVFLISLKAGGIGLNLTSADIVIHFDPWWNPAVEDQATDRAHRIGQKNVVEVIKLICKGTIEEKIISLQDEKRSLIAKLMGDDLSSINSLTALTEEEIIDLFN